jgi:hypothetical protein
MGEPSLLYDHRFNLKPNYTSNKTYENFDLNLNKTRHLIKNFNVKKFYEN